jgi:hypothetical protein
MLINSYIFGNLWTPQNLSGWVQLFIADSDNISLDSSSGVSQLNDLSGNGYHATQAAPGNRPVWSATSFGGQGGISGGNTSTQNLIHSATQPSTSFSTFIIATSLGLSNAYQVLYNSCAPNNQMRLNWYTRYNSVSRVYLSYTGASSTNPVLATSTSYVLTATTSGAGTAPVTYNCRTNGTDGTTVTNPLYAGDTSDRRCLFTETTLGSTQSPAIIGACGYINRVLASSELQLIEGWAAWKYNFVANLPAGHPYKSSAPTN